MDFIEYIKELVDKIEKLKDEALSEEDTKNAFVLPFFEALGYDTRNPLEFKSEFDADLGKKGEKVDYAIFIEGKPVILVETKPFGDNLDKHDKQLTRYFQSTDAKIGVLTNGVVYRFFTDLDETNKMDKSPFLDVNLTKVIGREHIVNKLKRFHKSQFDIGVIINSAEKTKYYYEIRRLFIQQMESPDEEFVKYVMAQVYPGLRNEKARTRFKDIVQKSFSNLINDLVRERLESTLKKEYESEKEASISEPDEDDGIVTTDEELQSYYIVKSILGEKIDPDRITYKDTKSYFGINLDNNRFKWICHIKLEGVVKYLELRNSAGKDERIEIEGVNDLYKHKKEIIKAFEGLVE